MKFRYNDGGRAAAGYKGKTSDCVCRAIAIAAELPYQEVYDVINDFGKKERGKNCSTARTGVKRETVRKIMAHFGFEWIPTMQIGQGCKTHLRADELPSGRIIVSVTGHVAAVIDGVLNDTCDCSRNGTRCVYGYFKRTSISLPAKQIRNFSVSECVGANLKIIRLERGITQQRVADDLGIPVSTYANFEQGRNELNYNFIVVLRGYFGLDLNKLFDLTAQPLKRGV